MSLSQNFPVRVMNTLSDSTHDVRKSSKVAGLRRGLWGSWTRRLVLLSSDIVSLASAWLLARYFSKITLEGISEQVDLTELIPVLSVSLCLFAARGLYREGVYRRDYISVLKVVILAVALLFLTDYFYSPEQGISQSVLLIFGLLSFSFICVGRFVIDQGTQMLRTRGFIRYSAVVIADSEHQERAKKLIENEQRYQIVDILSASSLDLLNRDDTFQFMQEQGAVEVFVSWDSIRNRMFLGQRLQSMGLTMHVLPDEQEEKFRGAKIWTMGDNIPCITFTPPDISGVDFWLKRGLDFCFALLFIILASPVYLAIAIAIRIDSPGPIFYKQTRIGLHGQPFKVWKFRSMRQDADRLQAELEKMNQNKDGVLFKIKDDPRITSVGQFIRRYSLDELPQIFNVLFGEMSFVGPRPLPVRDVEKFKQRYFIRQDVLPGITGMWQISGRSDIDNFDDVLKLDLYYIQNWSVLLDIRILFKTFAAVLQKSGAY